jgi:hypothetical protein
MEAIEIEALHLPHIIDQPIATPIIPIATQPTLQILSTKAEISNNGPHCRARSEPDWPPKISCIWKTNLK